MIKVKFFSIAKARSLFPQTAILTQSICVAEAGGNFLMDRTEFVLHVSDMSEIINVEASTLPGTLLEGELKRFLIWVSSKCFTQ